MRIQKVSHKDKRITQKAGEITSRLQKGGAVLSEMRLMVSKWSEELARVDSPDSAQKILSKMTIARARHVYTYIFRPRFIDGSPPQAWKLAQALETRSADIDIIRPFYYWITARAETAASLLASPIAKTKVHGLGVP